jgi:hypothetical protein
MKLIHLLLATTFVLEGCRYKPDNVVVFNSPTPGLYYTAEEVYHSTPVADDDRIYAHFERDGEKTSMLVLVGEDLGIPDVRWNTPTEVTLCLRGYTSTFSNFVTLTAGKESVTVHNTLVEPCPVWRAPDGGLRQ